MSESFSAIYFHDWQRFIDIDYGEHENCSTGNTALTGEAADFLCDSGLLTATAPMRAGNGKSYQAAINDLDSIFTTHYKDLLGDDATDIASVEILGQDANYIEIRVNYKSSKAWPMVVRYSGSYTLITHEEPEGGQNE